MGWAEDEIFRRNHTILRHGSLFSGIGGFDLAAEWMGWENVFHCEWNTFGQKILKHYWPNAISYEDITKTDFSVQRGSIDIISGGFPCQAFSTAGSRKGTEDSRYLWPEMLRVIREVCPRWVVGENVYGLVNWNGGLVFDTVCIDLENEGFKVVPIILPAASVNAPHKRDRIFFVAYSGACEHRGKPTEIHGTAEEKDGSGDEQSPSPWKQIQLPFESGDIFGYTSDPAIIRLEQCKTSGIMGKGQEKICGEGNQFTLQSTATSKVGDVADSKGERSRQFASESSGWPSGRPYNNGENEYAADPMRTRGKQDNREGESEFFDKDGKGANWENFPTQSPICGGDDGLPAELDGITFSSWRNKSIMGYGNAVVPQVVFQIFKAIELYEQQ